MQSNAIIKLYLRILPFYSLIGVVLSTFRGVALFNAAEYYLLLGAVFDFLVIMSAWRRLNNRVIGLVLFFLVISLILGLLNHNELSRRFLTDFTNPFFFFAKIYIFKAIWHKVDFSNYIKYYVKCCFVGSLILLPVVYFVFIGAGATRMAIFPPMELPFSYYMQMGGGYFFVSLLIIILYGKRAQFVGAVVTFLLYILVFKRREVLKYLLVGLVCVLVVTLVVERYSENYAIRRHMATFELLGDNHNESMIEEVAGSRSVEVKLILAEMNGVIDFALGKGFGFVYRFVYSTTDKMNANAHFTPVALLSKYGLLFSVFFYTYLLSILFKLRRSSLDRYYLTAVGTCLFVFIESFFAYAFFVTPIFPIAFGYILYVQHNFT